MKRKNKCTNKRKEDEKEVIIQNYFFSLVLASFPHSAQKDIICPTNNFKQLQHFKET
jgi:hypothetical protein